MIQYENSLFGFSLIFRVHGSALWKAVAPALISTGILLIYVYSTGFDVNEKSYKNTGNFDRKIIFIAGGIFFCRANSFIFLNF